MFDVTISPRQLETKLLELNQGGYTVLSSKITEVGEMILTYDESHKCIAKPEEGLIIIPRKRRTLCSIFNRCIGRDEENFSS